MTGKRKKQVVAAYKRMDIHAGKGTDYGVYTLSGKEWGISFAVLCCLGTVTGYLFYHHWIPALMGGCMGWKGPSLLQRIRIHSRQEELRQQFKQALYALISSLTAGRSVENAFASAVLDLRMLYASSETYILVEFERIDRKLVNGEPVERALEDFARRSRLEEVEQFAEVFVTCKRTGGNLAEVMRRTAHQIGEKMEIRQEIQVMLAQKRLESKIVGAAPILVVAMLSWTSPDYMAPLYHTGSGMVVMTICLGLFALGWWLIGRLMDIKV